MNDIEMVKCEDCLHLVPAANMQIHKAHACRGGRYSNASAPDASLDRLTTVAGVDVDPPFSPQEGQRVPSTMASAPPEEEEEEKEDRKLPARSTIDLTTSPGEVVNLLDESTEEMEVDEAEVVEVWACPRCTLHNSKGRSTCEACNYTLPNSNSTPDVRAADPVRRERLIQAPMSPRTDSFPLGYMSGGALLGGVIGATGAYLTGSPLSPSIVEGAVSGAVSGAVLREVFGHQRQQNPPPARRPPTTTQSPQRNAPIRFQRTNNGRSVVHRTPNGILLTYSSINGEAMDPQLAERFSEQLMQQIMGTLLRSGVPHQNVDNMSYEQLLAAFGDGTENMGAAPADIERLPLATVQDVGNLPEDCRQCNICLEQFQIGDQRRTLPCLHGFHQVCADKWLRTNGSCPVCKHKIRD